MTKNTIKRIGLFIISIPLAVCFNYFITMHLLDYINYLETVGYIISLFIQVALWYEFLIFIFDKCKKIDEILIIALYYFVLIFAFLARPYQSDRFIELNPFHSLAQLCSFNGFVISFFNILLFIPLITLNNFILKNLKKSIICAVIFGVLIEVFQFVLQRGVPDILDIILYDIGIILGIAVYNFLKTKNKV